MRLLLILMILTLTACGGGRGIVPVISFGDNSSNRAPSIYTVRSGDTLYSICWRYGLDYKTVARNNGIRSPYTIFVGQKIHLRGKSTASAQKSTSSSKKKTAAAPPVINSKLRWQWPTDGRLISKYSASSAGKKGIDIAGNAGQDVRAAADGRVVYSGNGLARYGNLLIIKHDDVYLSAYAHNQTLLVKEGATVKAGQKIATLGSTGTQRNKLHFEIRRNGKPIDPLRFLPKR